MKQDHRTVLIGLLRTVRMLDRAIARFLEQKTEADFEIVRAWSEAFYREGLMLSSGPKTTELRSVAASIVHGTTREHVVKRHWQIYLDNAKMTIGELLKA